MSFGQRIKAAREQAGITQVELGEKVGVSGVAIMRYEKGTRQPRLEQFQRIASVLSVDVNWLMHGQTLEERDQARKDYVARRFAEAELSKRLQDSYCLLTLEGKEKVVDCAEIMAEIPRYRRQAPPESPPAPAGDTPEGKDTPAAQDAPEGPEKGK
nr:helix-turn-helix transcriptional regulator [uncultured Oscillibacter sp.]